MTTTIPISVHPVKGAIDTFKSLFDGVVDLQAVHAPVGYVQEGVCAFAAGDVAEWPSNPPTPILYLLGPEAGEAAELRDVAALVGEGDFGNALGVFNAKGHASFVSFEGQRGFLATVDMLDNQANEDEDEGVGFLVGAWPVAEGFAVALLRADEKDVMRKMIGIAEWPTKWETIDVRRGE